MSILDFLYVFRNRGSTSNTTTNNEVNILRKYHQNRFTSNVVINHLFISDSEINNGETEIISKQWFYLINNPIIAYISTDEITEVSDT